MDTIYARSTAPGRAGVAIVRLSGPRAWESVEALAGRPLPAVRRAALRNIVWNGELLDQAIVVLFANGRSFTGEQSAELHLHGSEAVVRSVLAALDERPGLRLAQAGEFTQRALTNDRLTLSEVEGLSALISAETEAQRRQSMQLLSGGFSGQVADWRARVLSFMAALEVTVDFADEDVPQEVAGSLSSDLRALAMSLRDEARGVSAAQKISRGFEVAIVGAPNAGKSTLLNRLAGREAALTSEVAGTTRDVVEVRMEISGYLVTVLDTAGIRASADAIEQMGVARTLDRAAAADLRVFLDEVPDGIEMCEGDLSVIGKADLAVVPPGRLGVSGRTGEGVDRLIEAMGAALEVKVSAAGMASTERQAQGLVRAAASLEEASDVIGASPERVEVVSELLRAAVLSLEEVIGRVGVEDVLGEIFANFCVGK
mgnify:FL=1